MGQGECTRRVQTAWSCLGLALEKPLTGGLEPGEPLIHVSGTSKTSCVALLQQILVSAHLMSLLSINRLTKLNIHASKLVISNDMYISLPSLNQLLCEPIVGRSKQVNL